MDISSACTGYLLRNFSFIFSFILYEFCQRQKKTQNSHYRRRGCKKSLIHSFLPSSLEHFQFEMLCISNHTVCRFAEKTRFFRSLRAGRHYVAASRFTFFKVETLYCPIQIFMDIQSFGRCIRAACNP